MTPGLPAQARSLLTEAAHAYRGRPAEARLGQAVRQLAGPLRVALAGRVKAGKSTLLNALVGARVAATDAGECTKIVTWYRHGPQPAATAFGRSGPPIPLKVTDDGGHWLLELGGLRAEDLDRVEVVLPSAWLSRMILVDTPGMGSLTESAGRRTQDLLGETGSVDAVLYLLRHLHSSDVDFLDTFHEAASGGGTPVNAVGVLSRADELGGGEPGALGHAARVAAGYRADPRIHSLVHTVLPVAGLLAETASTLSTEDFTALAALAAAGEPTTRPLLLSTRRFTSPVRGLDVTPEARERLLDLLGVYGVRLSLDLVRTEASTVEALRTALAEHSGLGELRRLLLTQFAERRDVLKADGALRLVEAVCREDPIPAAPRLRQAVERLRANAHELTELRLLTDLRLGAVPGPPPVLAKMERLLGGEGAALTTRLGLAPDAPPSAARAALTELHTHWRRIAQNPLTDPALARAAQVLQRTCEGLDVGGPPPQPSRPEPVDVERTVSLRVPPRPGGPRP
ncbi:GTPase [Amycolatopsis vastitatis]|uniref:GTP-binding protein n=1 Tax=Amycolatopsis vastitatis TaxID=1905142 RepID=A0A229SWL5_9PSEU|nr:GTPase [Amycolatopsis vastitatis]OXM63537.1 GTP-binding protein [Amycolatopsis vastitatis]